MKKCNYILAAGSLSTSFLADLKKKTGKEYEILLAGSLRALRLSRLLSTLRSISAASVTIAIEDPSALFILPTLALLSLPIRTSSKRYIFLPDKKIIPFSYRKLFLYALQSIGVCGYMPLFRFWLKQKLQRSCSHASPVEKKITGKKILYLNENFWFGVKAGGSVGHIAGVINGFQRKGYSIYYASLSDNALLNSSIYKIELPFLKIFGYPEEFNYGRFSRLTFQHLAPWIKKNKPDFIYQRLSLGHFSGAILSQLFNIPLILEYNGSEVWCTEKWGKGLRYKSMAILSENLNLKQATRIVTVSDVLKEDLKNRNVPEKRIVCYPNCVDSDCFNPAIFTQADRLAIRRQYNINDNAVILTFLGTFGKWHGVDVLAQAIKSLIQQKRDWLISHHVHFLIVGDGAQMPVVRSILNCNDDFNFVTLTGLIPQDQAPRYLFASDILLSPHVQNLDGSAFFGSPTKLFEYMAMEKGIIASNLEQIGQILKNPQNFHDALALLCEPGNREELEKAIIYLVENPEIRDRLGQNARKEVTRHYTWDIHVNKILESL